jgi:hypothetical protein
MDNLFFWNSWNKTNRYLFLFLLSLFISGLLLVIVCHIIGSKGVVDIEILSKLENVKVNVDEFSRNLLNFQVQADSYIIKEWYGAGAIKVIPLYSYILSGVILIALLFILTSVTFLDSMFWYIIGMGGFIFFLVNLDTELLNIFFPNSRYFLIGLIIIYGSMSYYFKAFNQTLSFLKRILLFFTLSIVSGFVLFYFSNVTAPFLYISNYGISTAIIISILFIMIIAYDVIQGIFYLLTNSKNINTKNITLNFCLASTIYLANFLLLLLKKLKLIDWDIIYLNPFLIFFVSALIGLWAFKQKEILFRNIFSFQPIGAFLYLSFGIICFFTIAYCFITGNDAFIETFEYAIIYSNLCIGTTFLIYVLLNFSDLFHKNIQLYKIVYQARRTPFFVVYAGGIFAMGSLFLQSNQLPLSIYLAGYMNNVGDVYTYEEDYLLAREYYINGASNDYENWRSNYSLGFISLQRDELESAIDYYAQSNAKHPSEHSYLNLSNIYVERDRFFPAKFALEDGLKKFPKSSMLYNNLALLYAKTALLDSTIYFLELSKKYADEEVPKTNLLYFLVKHKVFVPADSIFQINSSEKGAGFTANGLSNYNSLQKKYELTLKDIPVRDSILNNQTFACLYNYGINKLKAADPELIAKIEALQNIPSNEPYAEDLRYLKALYCYYNEDKITGIKLLEDLKAYAGNTATIYSNTLGMWLMENNLQNEAAENLKQAISLTDQDIYLNYCIALAEAGKKEEALLALEPLLVKGTKDIKLVSNNMRKILLVNKDTVLRLEEPLRLQFLHLRIKELSEYDLLSIYSSFKGEISKYIAASELMNFYLNNNEIDKSRQIWYANEHDLKKENQALGLLNYQFLRFLTFEHNWQELQNVIDPIFLNPKDVSNKNYFRALLAESNNQISNAEKLYQAVLKTNPFNEEAVVAATDFYNKQGKTLEAYNILVDDQQLYPGSVKILKAYALQSLKINLESYGDVTLEKLRILLNEKDFRAFKNIYDQQKSVF